MSNKSPASHISLPKGGGAQKGLGEKFSPDLFTGTGNFAVPIALPPGRNGFQPEINLGYSTGNGNGPFGLGWSLSIPGVSRKTSKGIPGYDKAKDTFILSGAEDLVPVEKSEAKISYRPRTEGLFARIEHHHDAANDYWEVRSKDGLVSLYGTPASAGTDSAVIADPDDRARVFAWKLTSTTDPFGNCIEYVYAREVVQSDGPHHWDQLYLSEIRYSDYGDPAHPQFLITVKFMYQPRPDPFSEYRAGFEIRTMQRCVGVEVWTHADTDILTRSYHLIYLDQRGLPAGQLPRNGVSLLSQIRVEGHDGDQSESLPPLEFGYTRFEPEARDFFPLAGSDLPPFSLANPDFELVDLMGNGLPDVLQMNGVVRYWRNLGNGRFDLPREMKEAPAGLQLADAGVQMIDANGDGRTDLLVTKPGLSGYFPLRFSPEVSGWDRRSFQRYELAPSFNLEDPEVKLVDMDGDGVTDAIRSGSRLEIFFSDPQHGWNNTRWVERRALEDFPNINFSDPRVKWADMSGDGLQDIVLVHDGNVEYWPNLGYGNWGKRIHMQNSPRFVYGYDPKRILLGDVDGDGLADLVYVDDNKVTLWINQSGNGWSDPIEIKGTPPVSDMDAVRLADMLGNGISGVLWSSDFGLQPRASMYFLDFIGSKALSGGIKPYLLSEMNNHTGAVTKVGYKPSTYFYLADQKNPQTRWKTPLPFPVQVVAHVEVIDEISKGKLTTEYRYHHGYWDGAEREFRGFGMVEHLDTETIETFNQLGLHGSEADFTKVEDEEHFSPPTLTKTWFHQGPMGDEFGEWEETDYGNEYWHGDPQVLSRPATMIDFLKTLPRRAKRDALRTLRGSILRTELYARDETEFQDRPYTVTESLFGVREEHAPAAGEVDRPHLFFSHALAQRTTQWERGDDPMTQFAFTDDYDDYGQPRSQISIAVPRGRDFQVAANAGEPYLATQVVTTYANRDDDQHYFIGRVTRTTSVEILNDGTPGVFQLRQQILDGLAPERPLAQTLNFYDGSAFQGLPFGEIGDYGALVRSENLVLTDDTLREAYGTETPPYLKTSGMPNWATDYPEEFKTLLPALAGYVYHNGGPYATGYFAISQQQRYDFQINPNGKGRGLRLATRDPLGHETTIRYDRFDILPAEAIDPAGLTTSAVYDYRVLQPKAVTDPNGNRSAFAFTPLGLLQCTAAMGKEEEALGDTLATPGTELHYDFLAFLERQQPISVHTIKRVYHVTDTEVPQSERDETIATVEYSDGFGRLLQTRTQAEDIVFGEPIFGNQVLPADQTQPGGEAAGRIVANRVVVSGWQTYDNKGRVVEKYEPFFSEGWEFAQPTDSQFGQKAMLFYDPRGQVIRTHNPDGSEQRMLYGVPVDLSDPETFSPTPWETYTYDANDNACRTHATTSGKYADHWNTPASAVIDALGRTIKTVARTSASPADWLVTHSTYDIQGNLLTVTDARGRIAFKHVYDLANHPLRIESIDAGLRRTVLDAMGNTLENRDSKGALVLHAYDVLNRPLRLWARDDSTSAVALRLRLEYGDGSNKNQPVNERDTNRTANRLGKLYHHYDEAGLLTFTSYDFKGNVLEKARQVIGDAAILAVFDPANWQVRAFRADWEASNASMLLDSTEYHTTTSYDGLNRIKTMHYPPDVDGKRQELQPRYNRAGAFESVALEGKAYVERIAYNAKGQRTLIAYGNGVMTRYAYDPQTFRLVRLRTERYSKPEAFTYRPTGAALQDFGYEYDLARNILSIHDRTPGSGVPNSPAGMDALNREFSYDPIYRLLTATGREHATDPPTEPWFDAIKSQDPTLTRGYTEKYQYDTVGNILQMEHAANGGSFKREFTLVPNNTAPSNNRLATMTSGATSYNYQYDVNGNLLRESTSRHFEWDHNDRMKVYRTQTDHAEPSVYAHYLYDAAGLRVKKLVRKQGGDYEVTQYIDGIFEHHRRVQGNTTQENNILHVMDNQSRIALARVGNPFEEDKTPEVKFHLGDHLGSSNVVIDMSGALVNREEFTPYGETSFGSFARKRYRFTGKERDEESGLFYHGARYYAPWVGRWASCDPIFLNGLGINLYLYTTRNPITWFDPHGLQEKPIDTNNQQNSDGASDNLTKTLATGGPGAAKGAPGGPTLTLPNSYATEKMRAYGEGVVERRIGRVSDTTALRSDTAHRAAEAAFKRTAPPSHLAPGGKGWAADHIIELQHDISGRSGTSTRDFRWQDSRLNSAEGASSQALQRQAGHPSISGRDVLQGRKTPTMYGAVERARESGKLLNTPQTRAIGRNLGRAATVYGIYKSSEAVANAIVHDVQGGTGEQTARTVAKESAAWVGALALGAEGAVFGAGIGSIVPVAGTAVGGFIGGLVGGALGYWGGATAAEQTIHVGQSIFN
ncbi:MAG: SpvB/TcaC N-terminal domain-containing protein [bacterium]